MLSEVEALCDYRLRKHWKWPQLHQDMVKKGSDLKYPTLYDVCVRHPESDPTELTRYQIREYLKIVMPQFVPRPAVPRRRAVKAKLRSGEAMAAK